MSALAATAANQVGVVSIGVGTASMTLSPFTTYFFRLSSAGAVTQSYAVAGSGYLYSRSTISRNGDYSDAALDGANTFFGATEAGYPTTAWSGTNWATNIIKTRLA